MSHFRYRIVALATVVGFACAAIAQAAPTAPPLGAADSFAILAGSGITNTGPTTVTGDIGTFPTTSISGLSSMTIDGANNAGNAVTQQAKNDLVTAYTTVAGQGPVNAIAADLGGRTLVSGVYNSASSLGLTGTVTLDAQGNPNSVFIFQVGSAFTSASGSNVALINGAKACNVYWQIGSSATLGTGSSFIGTILALTSITVTTGVTIDGRVLARNGAVTLDTDTITRSTCATTPGSVTPPTTSTPGSTPGTTPGTPTPGTTPQTPLQKQKALAKKKLVLQKKLALKKRTSRTTTTVRVVAPPKTPRHHFGFTG
jgi:Ice-binding-like